MDSCCQDKACELEALRASQSRTLWIVLTINAVMFCFELAIGLLAGSVALLGDSLDMLGDTLVYGFSLYAVNRNERWRSRSALLKGGIMAVFALGVLGETVSKVLLPEVPHAPLMGIAGVIALIANGACLFLLTRHKSDDLNMRSTWLCSRNDIIANTGVIVAAAFTLVTNSIWPDVIIGLIITGVFTKSAFYVLREAIGELRKTPTAPVMIIPLVATNLCANGICPANACHCPA